jgi:EF hand
MNRTLLGALAALMLVAAGVFWWQGRAATSTGVPPPEDAPAAEEIERAAPGPLPSADVRGRRGPAPPEATELTREQKRFSRYDRDGDGRVTRNELLSTRTAAFRKLDADGNNLLTFEEWAVASATKFRDADANRDLSLTAQEFLTTRPKEQPKPRCAC